MPRLYAFNRRYYLFDNLSNNAGTNRTATFTNRKTQAFFHRNRVNQRDFHLHVVTRHYHLNTLWQLTRACHVSGAEVKLWTVAFEEWRVTTTFIFRQT